MSTGVAMIMLEILPFIFVSRQDGVLKEEYSMANI